MKNFIEVHHAGGYPMLISVNHIVNVAKDDDAPYVWICVDSSEEKIYLSESYSEVKQMIQEAQEEK